jgi:hypothetical protein
LTPSFRNFVLKLHFRRYYSVKYGNLVKRDHGPPAEGAARFHTTRWTIVVRAVFSQMQWRQPAFAGCASFIGVHSTSSLGGRGHLPAEINEEIHAFSEALIATGRRLDT